MKTILFPTMIVIAMAASEAGTQKTAPKNETYCMETRGAQSMVIYGNNKKLVRQIVLGNGSVLKADGILVRANGIRTLLEEGECVTQEGVVIDNRVAEK